MSKTIEFMCNGCLEKHRGCEPNEPRGWWAITTTGGSGASATTDHACKSDCQVTVLEALAKRHRGYSFSIEVRYCE